MKMSDIDKVNHLVGELSGMNTLIAHTNNADTADFELFIKLPGDSSRLGCRAKGRLRHTIKASPPRLISFVVCSCWQ
jgi:hypothetical protein